MLLNIMLSFIFNERGSYIFSSQLSISEGDVSATDFFHSKEDVMKEGYHFY